MVCHRNMYISITLESHSKVIYHSEHNSGGNCDNDHLMLIIPKANLYIQPIRAQQSDGTTQCLK